MIKLIKHHYIRLLLSLIVSFCFHVTHTVAEETSFLQFEREIKIRNLKMDTDFAVSADLLAITSNTSLFLADKNMQPLFPGNSFAPLKAISIDHKNNIWGIDVNNNDIINLDSRSGDIKRIRAEMLSMHIPTDISRHENGIFVWEKGSGHYAYLDYQGKLLSSGHHQQAHQCIAKDRLQRICINSEQNGIQIYRNEQMIAQYPSVDAHARYSDIAISESNQIWLSDSARGSLHSFSTQLKPLITSELISDYLQSPQRISITGHSIWLLDTTRQALIKLTLRKANSTFEHQLLAEEYYAIGNAQAALKSINFISSVTFDDALWLLNAKILYSLQRYKQAVLSLNKIKVISDEKNFWLGHAYYRASQFEHAITSYRNAGTPTALYNIAVILMEQQRHQEAHKMLTLLINQHPNDHWSRLALIKTSLANEQYSLVLQHSHLLLEDPLLSRHAGFYIGLALFKSGQDDEAIGYLQRASREGPYYTRALQILIEAHTQRGEWSLADKMRQALGKVRTVKQEFNAISIKEHL